MKNFLILCVMIMTMVLKTVAQENTVKPEFKFDGLSIEGSVNKVLSRTYSFVDFRNDYGNLLSLKPFDTVLYQNIYSPSFNQAGISFYFSFPEKCKGFYQKLNSGLNFGTIWLALFQSNEPEIHFSPDTLISIPEILLTKDSTYYLWSQYLLRFSSLSLHADYLLQTDPMKRLSVFGGIGVEAGRTISSFIREFQEYGYRVNYYTSVKYNELENQLFSSRLNAQYEISRTRIKNSYFIRATVPIGINYRLSVKDNFCGKINFYLNARMGFDCLLNPYSVAKVRFFEGSAFGVKVLL